MLIFVIFAVGGLIFSLQNVDKNREELKKRKEETGLDSNERIKIFKYEGKEYLIIKSGPHGTGITAINSCQCTK